MDWLVPLADLDYGPEEEQAVLDVLQSKWLTMGAVTQAFEQEFAVFTGAKYAFAVSNATAALHLACLALGLGPGDEVIIPSLSFVATSNAVLYTGARARFADIVSENDLTIDPEDIKRGITPATKAIMVMHYGGYPCRMREILEIANRYNLAVIEDAAHAPGAYLDGKHLGTWGDVGCFSFFSNKNLSTGEGGMIVTNRDDLAEKIRLQRSHGMTTLTYDRHKGHAYTYDVVALGYNYRIDEIHSALGRVQLTRLEKNNIRRHELTQLYWQELAGTGLGLPFRESLGQSACHLMPVILPHEVDRKSIIDSLRNLGIQTSIHYPPSHLFSYYRDHFTDVSLPHTEDVAKHEITLPLHPSIGEQKIKLVCSALRKLL